MTKPSDFLHLSNHARIHMHRLGTYNMHGSQLYIYDREGNLVMAPKFASPEDAEFELISLNEQLDKWEAYQAERQAAEGDRKSNRR